MVDVVHPRCKKEGCESRPSFNVEGEKKEYIVVNVKNLIWLML